MWISTILLIPSLFDALNNLFPVLTSVLYNTDDDYVQAFFSIFSPLSRLFVAKTLHEKSSHVFSYLTFWGTLLAWKLSFSYVGRASEL